MAEYINKEDVLQSIESAAMWNRSVSTIYEDIENMEPADVAPVVRCMECAEFDQNNCGLPFGLCLQWEQYTDCDGFCYRGKRKDDDHDG